MHLVLVIAYGKQLILYYKSTNVLKHEIILQQNFLGVAGFGH